MGIAVVAAAALSLLLAGAHAATIQTDLWVYQTGDTVTVTGDGFAADESVGITTFDPLGLVVDLGQTQADDAGDITYRFVLTSQATGIFTVQANGLTSGLQATTTFDPPGNPSNLRFTDARDAGGGINLAWNSGTSAQCYYIYRSTTGAPSPLNIATPPTNCGQPAGVYGVVASTATTFSDNSVVAGTRYWYGVTAVKFSGSGIGESAITNIVDTNDLTFTPSTFDFGVLASGGSATHTFTYTNRSSGTVKTQGLTFLGTNAADFSATGVPANNTSIAAGGTFTFTIRFAPGSGTTARRTAAAQLVVTDAAQTSGNAHQFSLAGTVDSAPTCSALSPAATEDTPASVSLSCTDPDAGDTLTYAYGQPVHGTLTGTGPSLTYTPNANFNGTDSFTFSAKDSFGMSSNTATATITVAPVNDAPVAANGSGTTAEDGTATIDLTALASDVETPKAGLTYTVASQPAHGTVSLSGGTATYTPAPNFNGSDSFTYTVTDTGDGASPARTSAPATVSLTVTPVDDAPQAGDGGAFTAEDTPTTIDLSVFASDVETAASSLTYTIVSGPAHGTLAAAGPAGRYTYTPAANFHGSDSFTYTVTDTGDGASGPLTSSSAGSVSITVTAVDDAPSLGPFADVAFDEGGSASVDLASKWSDVETPAAGATFSVVSAPAGLNASVSGGTLALSAADNLTGDVVVRGTDTGDGTSPPQSVDATIHVVVRNVAPSGSLGAVTPVPEFTGSGGGAPQVDGLNTFAPGRSGNGSFTVTLQHDVPAGKTLVVSVGMTGPDDAQQVMSMSDNRGNAYTYVNGFAPASAAPLGSHSYDFSVMTAYVTHALSAGDTISGQANTTTFTGYTVEVWQLSNVAPDGVETSSANDPHQNVTGEVDTLPVTTSGGPRLLFAENFSQHVVSFSAGAGWTTAGQSDDTAWNKSLFAEWQTVPDAGTFTADALVVPAETTLNVLIAFKPALGSGGPGVSTATLSNVADASSVDASSLRYAFDCHGGDLAGATYATASPSPTADCSFDNAGDYTVTGRVLDKDGGVSALYTFTVHVDDIAPTATLANSGPIDEGGSATVSFSQQLDGTADLRAGLRYAFACDDGPLDAATYAGSGAAPSTHCSFDDGPSTHTVRARVIDQHDGFTEYTTTVAVRNVAPTATFSAPAVVFLGSSFTLSLTGAADPSPGDTAAGFTTTFDCGTGFGTTATCMTPSSVGALTVGGRIADRDGGSSTYTANVQVVVPPPTATLTVGPAAEGSPVHVSLDGAHSDSPTANAAGFTYAFDCGSGYGPSGAAASGDCPTTDNGTLSIRATVFDAFGNSTEYAQAVVVSNVAPAVTAPGGQAANEGASALLPLGSFADPGSGDGPWHVSVDFGDGSAPVSFDAAAPGSLGVQTHTYGDNGTYTVAVRVTDKDGGVGTGSYAVAVADVAPTAALANDGPVAEGSPVHLAFSNASDPSAADTAAGFTFTYACDGTTFKSAATCTFADNGTYHVVGRVADKDGGSTSYATDVVVTNVAPTATFTATSPIDEGSSATLSLTNAFDPSSADTAAGLTYAFACDGLHFGAAVAAGTTTCGFPTPGTYTVAGRVSDKDGGTTPYSSQVVVRNVAPTLTAPATQSTTEGADTNVDLGSFTDPGANDGPWTVTVAWGDTTTSTFTVAAPGPISRHHTYDDNGSYLPTVTVADTRGGSDARSLTVSVANVAPTASFTATSPIAEGGTTTLALTSPHDPSTADSASLVQTYSCDGVTYGPASTCTFAGAGTYVVHGRIADKDGGTSTYDATVVVSNVAATLVPAAAQSGSEGAAATWQLGSFSDPGVSDGPWTVAVTWGDGGTSSFSSATQGSVTTPHTYANNGLYTVSVVVTDKNGTPSAPQSFTISIANVPPALTAPLDQVATEGTSQPFSLGSFADPGALDGPWTVGVDWGDGTQTQFTTSGTGLLAPSGHGYADNKTYTVTVSVTDKDGGAGTATFRVAVANATPVVSAPAPQSANEGAATLLPLGSFADPGSLDHPWAVDVDWGDGSAHTTFSAQAAGSLGLSTHAYPDNGSYTVTVAVTDKDGARGAATYPVTVSNVAPTATFGQAGTADEGSPATLAFTSPFDPSPADTAKGFTYSVACDGTHFSAALTCTFADSGTYTVAGTITDKDGGVSTYTTTVTVRNVAPTANFAATSPIPEGSSTTLSLTGAADPSPTDTAAGFTRTYSCDGTTYSATASCAYNDNGTYTVYGRIADKDGGTSSYTATVTVYDVAPTATFSAGSPAVEGSSVPLSFTGASDPSTVDTSAGFTYQVACGGTTFVAGTTCTFADNGTYTVTGQISDKDGNSSTYTTTVTVTNAPPTLTAAANQSAQEGTARTFSLGTFDDAGAADAQWTVAVDWGDGTSSSFAVSNVGAISYGHTYADNGSYPVSVTVTDKDHATSAARTFVATVGNVAPTLTAAAAQSSNEGSSAAFDLGSFADPGAADAPWTVDVDWGDGSAHTTFTTTSRGALGTKAHAYDDNGSHSVKVSVQDKDGGSGTASFTVTTADVAPTATFTAPATVDEGGAIALSLASPSDPSTADTAAGFTYAFDCGSGFGAYGTATTASCPTTDNGTRTVRGAIKDKDGGSREYTKTVTIANVAPVVTAPAGQSANEGGAASISLGSFADPGADSPWNVDVDWGDGSTHSTATAAAPGPLGSQSHTYPDNGTYTVTVSVRDKDGASGTATFAVTAANVAPTAPFPATATATAGQPLTLAFGTASDPSGPDTTAGFHYAFDCNGGSLASATYASAGTTTSVSCTYAAAGTVTARSRIYDKDGGFTEYTTTVTVTSTPPTAAFGTGNTTSLAEATPAGTQYTYSGTIANGDATTTVSADCGSVAIVSGSLAYTTDSAGKRNGFSFKCAFTYTTPTTYTLHATATRGSTTGPTATLTVTIANVAPTVTISSPVANWVGTRGTTLMFASTFTDPGGAGDGSYTCTINWGDGSASSVVTAASPGACNASHLFLAASTLITVTVTDHWGASTTVTRAIKVV